MTLHQFEYKARRHKSLLVTSYAWHKYAHPISLLLKMHSYTQGSGHSSLRQATPLKGAHYPWGGCSLMQHKFNPKGQAWLCTERGSSYLCTSQRNTDPEVSPSEAFIGPSLWQVIGGSACHVTTPDAATWWLATFHLPSRSSIQPHVWYRNRPAHFCDNKNCFHRNYVRFIPVITEQSRPSKLRLNSYSKFCTVCVTL